MTTALLIVRHADAGSPEEFAKTGRPDSERPISAQGRETTRASIPGLQVLVPSIDVIGTSRYTRALQTAELLAAAYGTPPVTLRAFEPEADPAEALAWIVEQRRARVVAIVGHEPHLGELASWLLSGRRGSFLELKKGGACLLSFAQTVGAGEGRLLWALAPSQLTAVGRRGERAPA